MPTIYSRDADGRERYDTVRQERVAEIIKRRKREGCLEVRVMPQEKEQPRWYLPNDKYTMK